MRGVLHGMARSKKNGVAPSIKEKKRGGKSAGGNIAVVETSADGNDSAEQSGGKGSSTTTKKSRSSKKSKDVEGSSGMVGAASRNTRDAVREEVMTQVKFPPVGSFQSSLQYSVNTLLILLILVLNCSLGLVLHQGGTSVQHLRGRFQNSRRL